MAARRGFRGRAPLNEDALNRLFGTRYDSPVIAGVDHANPLPRYSAKRIWTPGAIALAPLREGEDFVTGNQLETAAVRGWSRSLISTCWEQCGRTEGRSVSLGPHSSFFFFGVLSGLNRQRSTPGQSERAFCPRGVQRRYLYPLGWRCVELRARAR